MRNGALDKTSWNNNEQVSQEQLDLYGELVGFAGKEGVVSNGLVQPTEGQLADLLNTFVTKRSSNFSNDTIISTPNTIVLNTTNNTNRILSLNNDQVFTFRATYNNTNSCTINIDSVGAVALKDKTGSNLIADSITAGEYYTIKKYSSEFRIISIQKATQSKVNAGVDNSDYVTPLTLNTLISSVVVMRKIILSNNIAVPNTVIDFSAGTFIFSDYSGSAYLNAISKSVSTWAVGTGNGGLDTGTIANSSFYYCYGIYNPSTLISDVIFSVDATSPALPSGYTKYKKIGFFLTTGSAAIRQFYTVGNRTMYKTMIGDYSLASLPATRTLQTLTAPANVPVIMDIQVYHGNVTVDTYYALITETDYTDDSPSVSNFTAKISTPGGGQQDNTIEIIRTTDSNRQIALRSSDANLYLSINTIGFINDVL